MTINLMDPNFTAPGMVFIKKGNIIERVELKDIQWIQSDGNYCNIQTKSKKFIVKKSLVKILDLLPSHAFFRVHMKYIVAIEKIERFDLSINKITCSGIEIAVGPRFRADLIKILKPI